MAAFKSRGHTLAAFLSGAWRCSPAELEIIAEDLADVAPLLLKSGAGALGWWRIRRSSLRSSTVARSLRLAYLRHAAQALEQEHNVASVVAALRREGIRCMLLKGCATGRFYPEPGLRPPGDIDLCVCPGDRQRALALVAESPYRGYRVDLDHAEFSRFDNRSFEDFYVRSESIWIAGAEVKVLGGEDHLRFLCLHLLKHGGWRPLWLCDIAAVLEQLPANFDWDRCLRPQTVHADWILCTVGLARVVLEAQLANPDPRLEELRLPRWLLSSLLKQWSDPGLVNLPLIREQIRNDWRHPRELLGALRKRWPNAIQATVDTNAPFDDSRRLPFQMRNCKSRVIRVLRSG